MSLQSGSAVVAQQQQLGAGYQLWPAGHPNGQCLCKRLDRLALVSTMSVMASILSGHVQPSSGHPVPFSSLQQQQQQRVANACFVPSALLPVKQQTAVKTG